MAEAFRRLTPDTESLVRELAAAPAMIRGYEDVKLRSVDEFRARIAQLLAELVAAPAASVTGR